MPSEPWVENPRLDWLLKHLLLDHTKEPDDFEGQLVAVVQSFHDGLHGHLGASFEHDGYSEARKAEKDWLTSALTTPTSDEHKSEDGSGGA